MFGKSTSLVQKIEAKRTKLSEEEKYYPIYYALMGFLFGGILILSALNDFLFFGWLSISMSIIFGLLSINMIGKRQTKKY
ncbi:hypothetical protein LV716_09740 [Flagellimonas sp. HMM57]|uniref:hypothetical protein n=1 Tax=unclassified Flagellimonas TaxID=2644544 RepID=UPI0013D0981F|nr:MULTISPECIES: hypothetical protein [unclassified Flagellimonas]MBS9462416.1 hypothetical protein [Flagellimonas sp. 389]UII74549.1 hypothetical protein LV716_09740 [Flagellimonas sp. HMM57]